jgi:hypothetical protein
LTFVVSVASWIFYVTNGKKINTLSGNILTNLLSFALNKLSTEIFLCIIWPKTVLQVLALVAPRLTPLPTNRAHTCKKISVSGLVIQMTILNYFSDVLIFSVTFLQLRLRYGFFLISNFFFL